VIKDRPPRLGRIFVHEPLYFVTFCTFNRRLIPALDAAQRGIEQYGERGLKEFNTALGQYVVMPNHIHLFVRGSSEFVLSTWVAGLKRAVSTALKVHGRFWQSGFFDHVLRSDESYSEKWRYVRDNPVRAGLVRTADEWLYQGEIVLIDRA
jgi:putative transposase